MAEETVKQEGDFSLKGKVKPKKPKQLDIANKEIAKIDLKKKQEKVTEEVPKMDLTKKPEENAVQERKTEEVPVGETPGDSKKVDEQVRVSDTDVKEESSLEVIEEITEEVKPKEEVTRKCRKISYIYE